MCSTASSDSSTLLQWYAIDVDPCTGVETERDLLLAEPAGAAPIGRTTFRTSGGGGARRRDLEERKGGGGGGGGGKGGGDGGGGGGGGGGTAIDTSPPTREVGFRYSTGTSAGPKGLIAGQFIQPIFDFVFPELISFGANEVPNQFDLLPFLAMGRYVLFLCSWCVKYTFDWHVSVGRTYLGIIWPNR
jgi:hypothetical protein